jgi:hypothetical protein
MNAKTIVHFFLIQRSFLDISVNTLPMINAMLFKL